MLDLIYLALGLGMFGLLGLYAMAAEPPVASPP